MDKKHKLCSLKELEEKKPTHYLVNNLDLVVIKYGDKVSVLYGRCQHRGALMSDGYLDGDNLICGLHGWDYRYDTGVSEYNNEEKLHKFTASIEADEVYIDRSEIDKYLKDNPQPFDRDQYLGAYADTNPQDTEPYAGHIKELSRNGLKNYGHHGPTEAMGVDRNTLPKCEDIQFLPAQLATRPLLDDAKVNTKVKIGPKAKKPLVIDLPLFVTDMSFGALSKEAKKVRNKTGGIPIGFKIAASHIEADIDFALKVGVDYIILDGRGGATGAAPKILRNNINVPTIPALARARKHLDKVKAKNVTLIITGGLRVAEDFAKAMMLGADAIAVGNSALQAIGCLGMRACDSNFCPVGIATQKEGLRKRLIIEESAKQLNNFFGATNDLIKVIARACGYNKISKFKKSDLSTFKHDMHLLTGVSYGGTVVD